MKNELVTEDGVRLFVRVKGHGSDIVIVPNALYLENDFDALLNGRTFVFYDPRNRGRSDAVADAAKLSRGILNDVDDLDAVRRYVGAEQVDLIGHSYLGFLVALYAMRHSQHVRRVVQIGPLQPDLATQYPAELTHDDAVKREVLAELAALQTRQFVDPIERCRVAWSVLHRLYVHDARHVANVSHWGFCEHANERNMLAYLTQALMPSIAALRLGASDFMKATMPVLVIHGSKDRSAPYGGGRDWAALLPQARIVTLPAAAHVPWIEEPAVFQSCMEDFLNGLWPEAAKTVGPQ